jgi:hypothetical protein
MSVQWHLFNKEMVISPASLLNEIKRITVMPAHSSVAQFLDVYLQEAETAQPLKAVILKYCVGAWLYSLYRDGQYVTEEGLQILKDKATSLWFSFIAMVDALPDVWDENMLEP